MSEKKMLNEFVGRSEGHNRGKSDPNKVIGRKLKALYTAVEDEGIPERFLTLLEKLDMTERSQTAPDETDE
jgi:Anti-sigma factor NepR